MAEEFLHEVADEIGPETIVHIYDPDTGMKGVLVIDSTALGPAGGGTRMLSDITTKEICGLARAMTHKFAFLDLPRGGSKAGIWGDPEMPRPQKEKILKAFGKALRPYLLTRQYGAGADMGVDFSDVETIYEGCGIPSGRGGLLMKEKDGEILANLVTGYGVIVAARVACEFAGVEFKGAKMAIEGLGKVGRGAARYAAEAGAKIVAVSTIQGAIYNDKGLDVNRLLEICKKCGDRVVAEYEEAEHIPREALFLLPVDVLVPGARPWVINKDNAERIQARVISSGANIPITPEANETLFKQGVWSVPDFIANSGGVVASMVDFGGGTVEQVFKAIDELVGANTREVLVGARREGINPFSLAVRRNKEKVVRARTEKKTITYEEFIKLVRERVKLIKL